MWRCSNDLRAGARPGRLPGSRVSCYTPRPAREISRGAAMPEPMRFDHEPLRTLDGFRVELDQGRERADLVLDRPPLNVILMPQRDQLRAVFEALDDDVRVRVIVLRA